MKRRRACRKISSAPLMRPILTPMHGRALSAAPSALMNLTPPFAAKALAAGHDVPGSDVLALLAGDIRAEMVAVLDGLKARNYRLACITNNVKTGNDDAPNPGMARSVEKARQVADVMARFELVIESSVEGCANPIPAIYQLACDRLGLAANQCIFLDDLGVNLKPARAWAWAR